MKSKRSFPLRSFIFAAAGLVCAQLNAQSPAPALGKAAQNRIYAQRVMDELKAKNPDLLSISIYCVRPGTKAAVVVAGSLDQIGKPQPAEEADMGLHGASKIIPDEENNVKRYWVLSPLKGGGETLGSLVVAYPRQIDGQEAAVMARHKEIAAEISRLITNEDSIYQPYDRPMGRIAANKIYAQKLALDLHARHPELFAVALHAVPPGTKDQAIIANSRIDNINSIDPAGEVELARKGGSTVTPGVKYGIKRYQVLTTLRDASGQSIGLLVINYPRPADDLEVQLLAEQAQFGAELAKAIPNASALFQPADIR